MFEWLLSYPPDWFAAGRLELMWPWTALLLAWGTAAGLLYLTGYRRLPRRRLPFLLRAGLIGLLLLVLAGPVLVVEAPEPIRGHVAVLVDDSLSMRAFAAAGRRPADTVATLFGNGDGSIVAALDGQFETRYFRYGDGVGPLRPGEPLRHADARSDLGAALARVVNGHDAGSLAAVVVVSDGGVDPSPAARVRFEGAQLALRAAAVPVHVVDAGGGEGSDVEVSRLTLPRRALQRDRFEVEVEIVQHGLGGQPATLTLDDDGVIVEQVPLLLPADGETLRIRRPLAFAQRGTRRLGVAIAPLPGELETRNNRLERSIAIGGEPVRVLHFEGEPRFEVKFARRAVAADPGLRLVSLVRTAENKFYRLGIDDSDELAGGFPETPAALFRYQVLVLGSVEAALFSRDQQQAIVDFVARRGGGLLLLGGRRAFAEGGYADSALAKLMPVVLSGAAVGYRTEVVVGATDAGRRDALLDFGAGETLDQRFARLPRLGMVNPLWQAKPGASVLLEGDDGRGRPLVVLATQRYGLGRVVAFPVRNSWRWQMHAGLPQDDATHETLWRQLLRDLARQAAGRVRLTLPEPETTPGRAVAVEALVLDAEYRPMRDAEPRLEVTTPRGRIESVPMARSATDPARFRAEFVPAEPGRHDLAVRFDDGGTAVEASEFVDVGTAGDEFRQLGRDRALLRRLADDSGGRLIPVADAARLPALVDDTRSSRRVAKRLPLWDAPLLLLGLLLLAGGEWAARRPRRLA